MIDIEVFFDADIHTNPSNEGILFPTQLQVKPIEGEWIIGFRDEIPRVYMITSIIHSTTGLTVLVRKQSTVSRA